MNTTERLIEPDWSTFHPRQVRPVRHHVYTHPLLQMDPLIALGRRLQAVGELRGIVEEATAGTPFNAAATDVDKLRAIGSGKGWAILRYVQNDTAYRALVDDVLDSVRPEIDRADPGMYGRAGFIFVSSQHMVTPFHFDTENNFILQMRGRKRLYVWDPDDLEAFTELARDRFYYDHNQDLVQWREEFRERAHVFELEPGQGAYMPATSPHMVEASEDLSVTMSFTYYTAATRRNALLHRFHYMTRRLGVALPPVGRYPVLDRSSATMVDTLAGARRLVRRLAGQSVATVTPPYAGTLQ